MSTITLNENGQQVIADRVFENIARIAVSKIKGVFPPKKDNDFISLTIKDDEISILVTARLLAGVDVVKTCTKIQNAIKEAIAEQTNIECKIINIEVQGFMINE